MDAIFQNQFFILLGLVMAGLGTAAFFIFDLKRAIKKLYGGRDDGHLEKNLISRVARLETKLEEMGPRLNLVEEISKISVQKVGFLRFNPFQDTGGDQSFVAVLLNKEDSGVILSSLYTREGVRIFAKQVEKGKPKHQLSEEEKKVLEETINK